MYCRNCGSEMRDEVNICPNCGERQDASPHLQRDEPISDRSKIVAGVLGILLGSLGVHNFYLGYTSRGILQLCLTLAGSLLAVCTLGLSALLPAAMEIWGLVEGILILVGSIDRDGKGNLLV